MMSSPSSCTLSPFLQPPSWLYLAPGAWATTCRSLGGIERSGPGGAHAQEQPFRRPRPPGRDATGSLGKHSIPSQPDREVSQPPPDILGWNERSWH
ncbi:Centriolin [Manis pentadactyla]|nr:Centriolin [Manis pentadactyla]